MFAGARRENPPGGGCRQGMPGRFPPRREGIRAADRVRRPARRICGFPAADDPHAAGGCPAGVPARLRQGTCPGRRLLAPAPATAATIDVPEEEISRAIRSHLKMAEVIAEKDPATGEYCTLTGSWTYADVWSTPNSMLPALLLDPLGYHAQAERYLAVFRKHQGTTVPPGKAYRQHPGYLGTPKVYQAINWLSDNGALLWAFSEHALLTGDERFIAEYVPAIVKSCEWIRDARRITGHGGVEGHLAGRRGHRRVEAGPVALERRLELQGADHGRPAAEADQASAGRPSSRPRPGTTASGSAPPIARRPGRPRPGPTRRARSTLGRRGTSRATRPGDWTTPSTSTAARCSWSLPA